MTGETTLVTAPYFRTEPSCKGRIGFTVADVEAFYRGHERQRRALQHPAKEAGFR